MNTYFKYYKISVAFIALFLFFQCNKNEEANPKPTIKTDETIVHLTDAQLKNAPIETAILSEQSISTTLKLNGKVNFDLKHDMIQSLTNFELKNYDNTNSGIFISRLNKDTTELSELFDYITDDLSGVILNVSFIIYVLYAVILIKIQKK